MDPLSLTLSVITLATTVKDVGQKIHKSFAKVSDNLRNAKRVADDVKELVEGIEVFCKDHKDALDDMKDFRVALQGLLTKFQNFETSILPLLPQAGGSRRHRLFRGWEAWRNSNRIEGCILDLQSDIVKVMQRYMMKSAMRAEVELEKIHQETSRGLTGISQGLEVLQAVRRDVSVIRITTAANSTTNSSYEPSASASNGFDRQIMMFAQSALPPPVPLLRTPDIITEEIMTTAYIKLQINHIVMTLDKISRLPTPNDVDTIGMFEPVWIPMPRNTVHLSHFVVRQVLNIRELLETNNIQNISIRKGTNALNTLSIGLGALRTMGPESVQISKWAIKLTRILVDSTGAHPDVHAALGLRLANQSIQYSRNGDKIQSLQVIEEAHAIALNVRNQFDGEVRFQILYTHVLVHYASLVDTQRSINILAEAVQILEGILNIQGFTRSQTPESLKRILQSSSIFLHGLFSSGVPMVAISNYALALQRLGSCLLMADHGEVAVYLHLLAIAVRRNFVSIHGHEYKVNLADAISPLVENENTKDHLQADEFLIIISEGVQLFRELAECDPMIYGGKLIKMLWAKATILEGLGGDAEAIGTRKEVIRLAAQFSDDSRASAVVLDGLSLQFRRLKRYNDAARTNTMAIAAYQQGPEHQAFRYYLLSRDLGRLRRYKESTEAARTCVALHRHVAIAVPGTSMGPLTAMLSNLAWCLVASDGYSEALIVWRESVGMMNNFMDTNPDASSTVNSDYLDALRTQVLISNVIEDIEGRLEVSSTAAKYFRQLSELCCPQNLGVFLDLLWAEYAHAYNLAAVGRLQDAQQYINDWGDLWRDKLEATSNPDIMRWHAIMMAWRSNLLDAQGRTEEALLANQRVYNIVRPSSSTHHSSFLGMINSMLRRAQLQVNLGNYDEALKVAEEALQLARDDHRGPSVPTPVKPLHEVASIALSCRDYARAVEVALEGCKICASPSWQDSEVEFTVSYRPSSLAILSSAEASLGRYSNAVVYAQKAVELSLDIRDIRLHISAMTAEQSFIETRGNLAEILLITGNLTQARQICEERRAYFSKRIDTRMGEYRNLAPILRMLAILYCNEGRHDDGDDAAQELVQIMKRLGAVFPSLHEQVKIRLHHQAQVPILKVLDDMCHKLECKHQTEVVLLF